MCRVHLGFCLFFEDLKSNHKFSSNPQKVAILRVIFFFFFTKLFIHFIGCQSGIACFHVTVHAFPFPATQLARTLRNLFLKGFRNKDL